MKLRILLLVIICVTVQTSFAQLQRGNMLVGSNIGNLSLNLNRGGNFSATLNPEIAWFVKDRLALGVYAQFGIATAKDAGSTINYGLGALARYYFSREQIDLVRHARFFVEANAGIEGYNPVVGDNTNGLGIGIGPGLAYFITPSVSIEALAKFNGIVGFGTATATNLVRLSLGFQVYLPGNKIRESLEKKR